MNTRQNRVLFVHDGPLYYDKESNVYYAVHFSDDLRKRYLQLGGKLSFMMRVYPLTAADTAFFSPLKKENFEVISVPNFKSTRLFLRNYFKAKKIIEEAVRSHDLIVLRLPSAIGAIAARYARRYGKPVLAECVACTCDAYWHHSWKGKLIAYWKLFQQKKLIRQMNYVMYVTNKFLQKRYPTNGKQIHCSNVELDEVRAGSLVVREDKIKAIQDHTHLTLGTVGTLDVAYKGQADVIKAVAKLKKRGIFFKYKIVGQGDGSRLKEIIEKEKVADLVQIVGPIQHKKIFDFLSQIDIYIQPSKTEGLPRALIEAMSMGCPAIGSNAGGTPELLDERYIFRAGDIKQITKLLIEIRPHLSEQSAKNFSTALDYQKKVLHARRAQFYNLFLAENGIKSGITPQQDV